MDLRDKTYPTVSNGVPLCPTVSQCFQRCPTMSNVAIQFRSSKILSVTFDDLNGSVLA